MGHVTYKSHGRKNNKTAIILIPIVIAVAIIGYLFYQNYSPSQTIQSEANNVINNASNTIRQIPSQINPQSNADNRVPIAVHDSCQSFIRTDLKTIDTTCTIGNMGEEKQFKFNIPDTLEQALQGSALGFVKTKVYQYGANDFKIGLYDQVGEKNYTVTLWQLP